MAFIQTLISFFFLIAYHKMYILEPGESKPVEALTDPIGLKIAIVYDAAPDGQVLMYQRWAVKNESVLTITSINGTDIATYGGKLCICIYTNIYILLISLSLSFYYHSYYYHVDNTANNGKGTIRERNESAFALAIDALTYTSPVSRSIGK